MTIYSTITFVGDPLFASGRGRKNPFPLATVVEPLKAPSHSAKGTHLRGDALTVPTIRRVVVVPPRPSIRIFSLMSILTLRYRDRQGRRGPYRSDSVQGVVYTHHWHVHLYDGDWG